MRKIHTAFDDICIYEETFTISFPFLQSIFEVNIGRPILDVCATHNFLAIVTNEEIFIAHKNKLQDPLRCIYKKNDQVNLEFEPSSWVSVVLPFTENSLNDNWCKEIKPLSDVILTATTSTVYLICNIKDSSMLVRLFNETAYFLCGVVKSSVVQIPEGLVIVMVASGYDHSIFLASEGSVYALGTGSVRCSRGELGVGLVPRVCELTWLEALEGLNIVAVAAAGWHSAALTDDGDVYLWGWNHRGQLGDKKEKVEFYPSPLDIQLRVVRIALGEHFTALWIIEGIQIEKGKLFPLTSTYANSSLRQNILETFALQPCLLTSGIDEDEPSIIMGSKKIGMPAIQLTYYSETTAEETGKSSQFSDCQNEAVIFGEYEE